MDHHVHTAITDGLRRRGINCTTAAEDGRSQSPDDQILQRSTELRRVLFSNDHDLLIIAAEWLAANRAFAGLAFAEQLGITVGQAIADLELIANASEPEEWANRIEFLPL